MTTERHIALDRTARTANTITTNLAALLTLCSMSGTASADVASNPILIQFPDAITPTAAGSVDVQPDIDSLLSREIVQFVRWLTTSQATADPEVKAALYRDRWSLYL